MIYDIYKVRGEWRGAARLMWNGFQPNLSGVVADWYWLGFGLGSRVATFVPGVT